jgi:hypothetical protein
MRYERGSEVVNVVKWVSEDDAGPSEHGMSVYPWASGQAGGFPSTIQLAFVLSGLVAPCRETLKADRYPMHSIARLKFSTQHKTLDLVF